jgi:hypothetical protein
MMEQEIVVVGESRAGICVFRTTMSNEPSIVAEMEQALAHYLAECKEEACTLFCKEQPCVWLSSYHESMKMELEHSNLPEGGGCRQQLLDKKNSFARWQSR